MLIGNSFDLTCIKNKKYFAHFTGKSIPAVSKEIILPV